MSLIEINDNLFEEDLMLFDLNDNRITAYLFDNDAILSNKEIKKSFSENELDVYEIGSITVNDSWFDTINVDERYRCVGIGSKLVQLAIDHLHLQCIPCVQTNSAYQYSLTPDGERLVAACINQGIITADMCIFSDSELLEDYASGDPGLVSSTVRSAISQKYPGYVFPHKFSENKNTNSDDEETVSRILPYAKTPGFGQHYPMASQKPTYQNSVFQVNTYQLNESLRNSSQTTSKNTHK